MAGEDKREPRVHSDSKLVRRRHDGESEKSSADGRQSRHGVVKKMQTRHGQDTAAVDRWFDRQLNQLYSDVISEPLPKEFLELIEKLREKTPK